MKPRALLVVASALALGFGASAVAAGSGNGNVGKIVQSKGCTGCHTAKTKVVGPPWDWVAWRYRGKPKNASVTDVAKFIINGGTGYWAKWTGGIPMPAHPDLSMKQAKAIAKWVLAHPAKKPSKAGGK